MLSHLKIKNLALLESVELELTKEFIAITGETGAGKSVLVGALRLLAGAKADKSIIREGAASCDVEGLFNFSDTTAIDKVLEEVGLPVCEEGQLVISRSVGATKPSKISVNGGLASVGALQKVGAMWLEYNSPEAVLELYTSEEQLAILDVFGGIDLAPYTKTYAVYSAAKAKLEEATTSGKMTEDELQFLEKQIARIDNLKLSEASLDALEKEYKRLTTLETELAIVSNVVDAFELAKKLSTVVSKARQLATTNDQYSGLVKRLESAIIDIDDQESTWKELAREADLSPAERDAIAVRMGEWMELKRRYGSLEGVMQHRESLADKLLLQQNIEMFVAQYEQELSTATKVMEMERAKLLKARKAAAATLITSTEPILKKLGLPKAQIAANFEPTAQPTPNGGVSYELMFNANPGQALKPLSQVASSGELARVMLSLKTVLIKAAAKPVIVFDEVDANVGGEVATSVAELLQKLGHSAQVFCITHLPQVAAKANFHLLVKKNLLKNSTSVTITAITDQKTRLEELARMLGDRNASTALEHAKVLLRV